MDRSDKGIGNVFSHGDRSENQFVGTLSRKVFQAMHRNVDKSINQGSLNFLCEYPCSSNSCKW